MKVFFPTLISGRGGLFRLLKTFGFHTVAGSFYIGTVSAKKNLDTTFLHVRIFGIKGFEPMHSRTKNDCLTSWLYSTEFAKV